MPEFEGIEDMDAIGVQNDGEPAVVVEDKPTEVVEEARTEAKAEEETTETTEEVEKPHKKTGSQRARERADREAQLRKQAEQERDELKAKLAGATAPVVDADEPSLEAFDDFASWKAALASYHEKKAVSAAEQKIKAEQQRKEHEMAQQKVRDADARFAATKPDWDDVMEDLGDVVRTLTPETAPGFQALDMALTDSEACSALKYHLGQNPDEFRRLVAMEPIRAVKELMKIELGLSTAPTPKPEKKTSQAPPPIRPVSPSATIASSDRYSGIEIF